MWRRLIWVVGTVEAGVLAAILAALVIDPGLAAEPLTSGTRRLCALAALVLMLGGGYGAIRLLSDAAKRGLERVTARRAGAAADGSGLGAADLAKHQLEQATGAGRDRRAA